MGIEEAIGHLDADRWQQALDAFVKAWRASRCPELAAEIDRLSAFVEQHQPPIEAKGRKLQGEWEQRFVQQRAVELGVLLDALAEGSAKDHKARFRMLTERPADPRLTPALSAYADEVRLSSTGARPAWTAFFKLVAHGGDPRMREGLAQLEAWARAEIAGTEHQDWVEFPLYVVGRIEKAVGSLPEAGSCTQLAEIRAAVDRALARPFVEAGETESDVDLEALEAAVHEDPTDEGMLAVWADALIASGDARGEMVMLQLAAEQGKLKKKDLPKLNRMLRQNLTTWLGPLAPFVEPDLCRFRRGLLEVTHIVPSRVDATTLDLPGWRSVEQASGPVEVLSSPALLSLTRLGTVWLSDPDGVKGPVGWAWQQGYRLRPDDALAVMRGREITHLELLHIPDGPQARALGEAAPALDFVALHTTHHTTRLDPSLAPLMSATRAALIEHWYGTEAHDADWLQWFEVPELHVYAPQWAFHRSWFRRDRKLELVLTDTRGYLVPDDPAFATPERKDGYAEWAVSFLQGAPRPDTIVVRGKKGWPAEDVDRLARVLGGFDVTLPKAKRRR